MSVGTIENPAPGQSPDNQTADAEAPLVALSDKAAEKVREIRTEENIEDTYALRLKVQGGGCSGFSYDLYFDLPQDIDHSFASRQVDPYRRFVEHQQLRLGKQCGRNVHPPLQTARQVANLGTGALIDPRQRHRLGDGHPRRRAA